MECFVNNYCLLVIVLSVLPLITVSDYLFLYIQTFLDHEFIYVDISTYIFNKGPNIS